MWIKRKLVNKIMPKEFGFIAGLFHAGIFHLQSCVIDTIGNIGYKDYIFPSIKEAINRVENIGMAPIAGETMEEFGNRFIKVLKKSLLVKDAEFKKINENEYEFSLIDCFMASSAHTIAGTKGVCPMAMTFSAMVEKYSEKDIDIEYSELTPKGSKTKILTR